MTNTIKINSELTNVRIFPRANGVAFILQDTTTKELHRTILSSTYFNHFTESFNVLTNDVMNETEYYYKGEKYDTGIILGSTETNITIICFNGENECKFEVSRICLAETLTRLLRNL